MTAGKKSAQERESENLGYILTFCQKPPVAMRDLLNHSGPLFSPLLKTQIWITDFRGAVFVFCIFFMLH